MPIFFLFIHSHSQHRTPGTSPYVTPVLKHLVISLLLFSTQSSHHELIQQSSNNNLTFPLRKSCLFWVVKCFCIYACNLCCKVRVESEYRQQHRLLSLPPCSQHVKSDTRQQHGSTKDVTERTAAVYRTHKLTFI